MVPTFYKRIWKRSIRVSGPYITASVVWSAERPGITGNTHVSNTHDFFQLSRLLRWHIESEAINRALAMVSEAQTLLPIASHWGLGITASSDGQFFPSAR